MKYDLAVIGGGPAGMMAAGRAGELGARVILLEKNNKLGVKLLATGGGRCNLTNKIVNQKDLISQYGEYGKFLYKTLNKFGVDEVIDFFTKRGVPLKIEAGNRVFPISNQAVDILTALADYLRESKVTILTNSTVRQIVRLGKAIEKIVLADGSEILAEKYIIATGGKSYPQTGSSGDGYQWVEKIGHTVIDPRPALAPIVAQEAFCKELQGISLSNVLATVYKQGRKIASQNGEIMFTGDGLSGPAVINLSKVIGQMLPEKTVLQLDFFPQYNQFQLDEKIRLLFGEASNKLLKNCFDGLLPPRLASVIVKKAIIDPDKKLNSVTREERKKLARLLKEFTVEVRALAGFDKAMVTAGGVSLSEIDSKTMKSKIIDNLFFAGEILDLDGPTGGYNLQICWSTGYVAGESIDY
jgi:predicted Rossmann fold flavoprotein